MKSCEWCKQEYKTCNAKSKYCSLSCFGKANRTGKPAIPKPLKRKCWEHRSCIVCEAPITNRYSKYCSNACQWKAVADERVRLAREGVLPTYPKTLRKLLFDLLPHECSICGSRMNG